MGIPWWLPWGEAPSVEPETLRSWMESGRPLQFADARTEAEFRRGSIGKARHAPVTAMPTSIRSLALDPARPVIVLCLSGHRSLPGTRWLRARGYEAYSLKGGIMAWRRAGYGLESGGADFPGGSDTEKSAGGCGRNPG